MKRQILMLPARATLMMFMSLMTSPAVAAPCTNNLDYTVDAQAERNFEIIAMTVPAAPLEQDEGCDTTVFEQPLPSNTGEPIDLLAELQTQSL